MTDIKLKWQLMLVKNGVYVHIRPTSELRYAHLKHFLLNHASTVAELAGRKNAKAIFAKYKRLAYLVKLINQNLQMKIKV